MILTFCYTFLKMPIPQLWAVLFFLMLLLLGITSQVGALEGFIAPFYDLKLVHMRKELFTGNNSTDGVLLQFGYTHKQRFLKKLLQQICPFLWSTVLLLMCKN